MNAGSFVPRAHDIVKHVTSLLVLDVWRNLVLAHLNARFDIQLRVDELISRIEQQLLFGLRLAQVKDDDLAIDSHLKQVTI